jgi:hypothetical protein
VTDNGTSPGPFGGLSPHEAARKSAESRRAKKSAAEEPLDAEAILERMARTSKSDHVKTDAAKALLAIRAKREGQVGIGEDAIIAARHQLIANMTPEERDLVVGVLDQVIDREVRPSQMPADRVAYLGKRKELLWREYRSVVSEIEKLGPTEEEKLHEPA